MNTVLKNLQSDTVYAVTVVPVYAAGEGKRMTENGKTCGSKSFPSVSAHFSAYEVCIFNTSIEGAH